MKLITGGRRSGKTTKLVQHAAKTGGVLIVVSNQHRRYCLELAEKLGVKIKTPVTVAEVVNNHCQGRKERNYMIDDLDSVLSWMFNVQLSAATVTED